VAYKILYNEDALADLEATLDYIRADNPRQPNGLGRHSLITLNFYRISRVLAYLFLDYPRFASFFIHLFAFTIASTRTSK